MMKRYAGKAQGSFTRRDVLRQLYEGMLSLSEAYRIQDQIISSADAANVNSLMGLSADEWTAHLHGMPVNVLAKWRYEGWPNVCTMCGRKLDYQREYWLAKEMKGQYGLIHNDCLKRMVSKSPSRRSASG